MASIMFILTASLWKHVALSTNSMYDSISDRLLLKS